MSTSVNDISKIQAEIASQLSRIKELRGILKRKLGTRRQQSLMIAGQVSDEIKRLKAALLQEDAELCIMAENLEVSGRDASVALQDASLLKAMERQAAPASPHERGTIFQYLQPCFEHTAIQIFDLVWRLEDSEFKLCEKEVDMEELDGVIADMKSKTERDATRRHPSNQPRRRHPINQLRGKLPWNRRPRRQSINQSAITYTY